MHKKYIAGGIALAVVIVLAIVSNSGSLFSGALVRAPIQSKNAPAGFEKPIDVTLNAPNAKPDVQVATKEECSKAKVTLNMQNKKIMELQKAPVAINTQGLNDACKKYLSVFLTAEDKEIANFPELKLVYDNNSKNLIWDPNYSKNGYYSDLDNNSDIPHQIIKENTLLTFSKDSNDLVLSPSATIFLKGLAGLHLNTGSSRLNKQHQPKQITTDIPKNRKYVISLKIDSVTLAETSFELIPHLKLFKVYTEKNEVVGNIYGKKLYFELKFNSLNSGDYPEIDYQIFATNAYDSYQAIKGTDGKGFAFGSSDNFHIEVQKDDYLKGYWDITQVAENSQLRATVHLTVKNETNIDDTWNSQGFVVKK